MPTVDDVAMWIEEVNMASERIGARFSRFDLRSYASRFLRGRSAVLNEKTGSNWLKNSVNRRRRICNILIVHSR